MVTDELFDAQRELLRKGVYLQGYKDFFSCHNSYYKRPELVILTGGCHYIDGLVTCNKLYCSHFVKSYLFKASKDMAKVNDFIRKEKLRPTLLTLTLPHKVTDSLKYLKVALDKATRNFLAESKNKLVKEINKDVGSEGYVLRNEVTYTGNGWNTHCHVLNLNHVGYSEIQKDLLVDEFTRQLEDSGFHFSRLDKYNIEKKGGLIHFRENSFDASYLSKYDEDNPVNLALTNLSKYIEFAQSFNVTQKIPLVKFKNGLKSKLGISSEKKFQREKELRRIQLPESLIYQSPEYVEEWLKNQVLCS